MSGSTMISSTGDYELRTLEKASVARRAGEAAQGDMRMDAAKGRIVAGSGEDRSPRRSSMRRPPEPPLGRLPPPRRRGVRRPGQPLQVCRIAGIGDLDQIGRAHV